MTWAAGCSRDPWASHAVRHRATVQLGGLPIATPWLQAIPQHVLGTLPAPWLTEVYRTLLGLQ